MRLRGGTVQAYLQALRDAATVPGATEYTLRPPLVDFLHAAAHDLELAPITVQPGCPKPPGPGAAHSGPWSIG